MTTGDLAGHPGPAAKDALRRAVTVSRQARPPEVREAGDALRDSRVIGALPASAQVIAAYASFGSEPGTLTLIDLLHRLGIQVLLPVLRPRAAGSAQPDWAVYAGTLQGTRSGIRQPTTGALGAAALGRADVVLLPGLAGDPGGGRLGTGGGWYDRALRHSSPDAPRWLLLHDDEVVHEVPLDPWDQPVTALVTPTRWLWCGEPGPAPGARNA